MLRLMVMKPGVVLTAALLAACTQGNETGHSLGLRHPADLDNHNTVWGCMSTHWALTDSLPDYYNTHNVNHINGFY